MKKFAEILFLLLIFGVAMTGCSRARTGGSSQVSMHIPKEGLFAKGEQANDFPSNRKACWGINVSGPEIESVKAATCTPELGLIAGFVENGQELSLEVPQGLNRKFELYLYLMEANDTGACPKLTTQFPTSFLSRIYSVGTVSGVALDKAEVALEIPVRFPGLHQTIAKTSSLPSTCVVANTGNIPGFGISSEVREAAGGHIIMKAQVGRSTNAPVLSAPGIRLRVTN